MSAKAATAAVAQPASAVGSLLVPDIDRMIQIAKERTAQRKAAPRTMIDVANITIPQKDLIKRCAPECLDTHERDPKTKTMRLVKKAEWHPNIVPIKDLASWAVKGYEAVKDPVTGHPAIIDGDILTKCPAEQFNEKRAAAKARSEFQIGEPPEGMDEKTTGGAVTEHIERIRSDAPEFKAITDNPDSAFSEG